MPEELAPEIKLALARALRDLLLRGNRATVTLTELLQQLEPQWHEQVRSYWLACGSEHINRSVALTRLLALLDEVTLELSDDDEAQIAVLSHS